ncbi:MAG: short-chain dehydrogenase/reductase [Hyphomicrobiales bacterium]|nr:short-chain dehydrogenase/reductase [Hyphomicrobiales bacterium]
MSAQLPLGTALITGASSGIGEVYADRLAKRGHDLILVARNADRLAVLTERLAGATGRKVETIVADLGVAADRRRVESRLRDDQSIALLINNAGVLASGPLASANADDVEAMLDVNVTALTRLAAAAAAAFVQRGSGAIVNLSSVMSMLDTPNTAAYGATKAYVLSLTHSLHLELAPRGVQVQAVLPGYTRTPMIQDGEGLPPELVMEVDDLVDAALAGLDQKELITIPSQHKLDSYQQVFQARADLVSHLVGNKPAARYNATSSAAA